MPLPFSTFIWEVALYNLFPNIDSADLMGTQPPMTRCSYRQSNQPPSVILPDDFIVKILSWRRVKPLMKMKCVSKAWNTLISDSIFVKMHLFRSAQKSHYYLVSSKKSKQDGDYSFVPFVVCDLLKNCSVTLLSDPYYRLIDKGCRHVVVSCNGLAACSIMMITMNILPPYMEPRH